MTRGEKAQVNAMLLARIESLAQYLFPDGEKKGRSWRVGSLDINLKTGMWGDWDGGTKSMSRNLIDLWIYATGSNFVTAITEIRNWLGMPCIEAPVQKAQRPVTDPERKLRLPLLEKPTHAELRKLSDLRSISIPALTIAVRRGFLWTYQDRKEGRAWLITDSVRKSAIGRRLDGKLWECNGKKAKTLFGSWGHYPIGIADAATYQSIGLVEGSPDFLALIEMSLAFNAAISPVCMAGVNMTIPESQLPLFNGKRVRIFIHDDRAGIAASKKWFEQLSEVAEVDGYLCGEGLKKADGSNAQDLNDLCDLDGESWNQNRRDIECLLDFACACPVHKEEQCLA